MREVRVDGGTVTSRRWLRPEAQNSCLGAPSPRSRGHERGKALSEPISNMLTVFVMAIALALPTFGLALAGAVNQEVNRLDAPPQLSVLTEASLTLEDAKQLAKKLSAAWSGLGKGHRPRYGVNRIY